MGREKKNKMVQAGRKTWSIKQSNHLWSTKEQGATGRGWAKLSRARHQAGLECSLNKEGAAEPCSAWQETDYGRQSLERSRWCVGRAGVWKANLDLVGAVKNPL